MEQVNRSLSHYSFHNTIDVIGSNTVDSITQASIELSTLGVCNRKTNESSNSYNISNNDDGKNGCFGSPASGNFVWMEGHIL